MKNSKKNVCHNTMNEKLVEYIYYTDL